MIASDITTIEQLQTYLIEKGANEEQASEQICKLGDVIILQTIGQLLAERPPTEKLSDEAAAEYIRTHFSSEEISQKLEACAVTLVQGYVQTIENS